MAKRKKIGYILLAAGLVDRKQMEDALRKQAVSGGRLGDILVEMGALSEENLARALSKQLGLPYMKLDKISVPQDLLGLLSGKFLLKNRVIPVSREGNNIRLAMANPLDHSTINDIEFITASSVQPMVTTPSSVERFIRKYVLKTDGESPEQVSEEIEPKKPKEEETPKNSNTRRIKNAAETHSVVKTVNKLIFDASKVGAVNIHIEPRQENVCIRHRIDGLLRTVTTLPPQVHGVILSRLKMMAGMDISQCHTPQEGRAEVKMEGRETELRMATLPTLHGEKMVIGIQQTHRNLKKLEDLNMTDGNLSLYRSLLSRPQGIVLITGPSDSGKLTTLYASLLFLHSESVNIVTLEEFVKYRISGANQVQISEKSGLTFLSGLRTAIRHDPDIIMLEKTETPETAEMICHASLTGQKILSTLHTHNAVSAITQMSDFGISPYLLASSVAGVAAKRLVQQNCPHCLEEYVPDPHILAAFHFESASLSELSFYRGQGCKACNFSGYSGRIAIYEVLSIEGAVKELIIGRASEEEMMTAARNAGMVTMEENGLYLVIRKLTTPEELLRVIPYENIIETKKEDWKEKIRLLFETQPDS